MSATVLSANVLVLNKFYMAVQVVSVRRAFAMLAKRDAEVVEVAEAGYLGYDFESWIGPAASRTGSAATRSTGSDRSMEILAPRVIRLMSCERIPTAKVKFNRRNIFARDGNRCQYCGKKQSTQELSLDHVVPKSRGGALSWTNIVVACTKCNARKGGRLPHEAGMHLIREPFAPKRSPLLSLKARAAQYASWRYFLDAAYWSVELK